MLGCSRGLLLEASIEGPLGLYTSGRCVDLPCAGPLLLHKAPLYVEGHAVGGGEAAANRIAIYTTRGLV